VLALILLAAAAAEGRPAIEVRPTLGWGGWVSPGEVTPLRVDVRAVSPLDGMLIVEVPAGPRGSQPVRHVLRLRMPGGGRQQVHLDIAVTDPRRPIVITLRGALGERLRQELPVGVDRVVDGVVAALTHDAAGLEFLAGMPGKRRPVYLTEADLPVRWQTYDGVDLLILRDLDARTVVPAQSRALVEWVAQGGRLLVVAPDRLDLGEAPWLAALLPAPGQRALGRGIVEVAGADLFTPGRRAGGELRTRVLALLDAPIPPSVADPALSGVLPTTRPLPGGTQLGLAMLSLLYIVGARLLLPRFGASRAGWILIPALIGVATAALYTFAAGARTAATSVAQLSIAEVLGTLGQARVTTYASVIAPYGGGFVVPVREGAAARALTDAPVTYDESRHEIQGSAPAGQISIVARQIVPLQFTARLSAPGVLTVDRGTSGLHGALLYRQRQLYRLPEDLSGTIRLDPARWEPVDRAGTLGGDVGGRAMDLLFRQLDRASDGTWLIAQISDDRFGVRAVRAGTGDAVALAVAEVR
jgi:hypothetical protein